MLSYARVETKTSRTKAPLGDTDSVGSLPFAARLSASSLQPDLHSVTFSLDQLLKVCLFHEAHIEGAPGRRRLAMKSMPPVRTGTSFGRFARYFERFGRCSSQLTNFKSRGGYGIGMDPIVLDGQGGPGAPYVRRSTREGTKLRRKMRIGIEESGHIQKIMLNDAGNAQNVRNHI